MAREPGHFEARGAVGEGYRGLGNIGIDDDFLVLELTVASGTI